MNILGRVRQFLAWERRALLGEEEWEFATTRDMAGLTQALDQRLTRRSTAGDRMVWSSRLRALSVHAAEPDRIQVFWNWGYWSPFPRLLGGLYFDGRLSSVSDRARIVGRFRQPVLSGAFFLFVANAVVLWLLFAVAAVAQHVVGCVTYGDDRCELLAQASAVFGLGVLVASFMLAMIRYVVGGSIFSRGRIRMLLTDVTAAGTPT